MVNRRDINRTATVQTIALSLSRVWGSFMSSFRALILVGTVAALSACSKGFKITTDGNNDITGSTSLTTEGTGSPMSATPPSMSGNSVGQPEATPPPMTNNPPSMSPPAVSTPTSNPNNPQLPSNPPSMENSGSSGSSGSTISSGNSSNGVVECELVSSSVKVSESSGIIVASHSNSSQDRICMSVTACMEIVNKYAADHDCTLNKGPATTPNSGKQCTDVFPGSNGTCKNAVVLSDDDVSGLLQSMGSDVSDDHANNDGGHNGKCDHKGSSGGSSGSGGSVNGQPAQ